MFLNAYVWTLIVISSKFMTILFVNFQFTYHDVLTMQIWLKWCIAIRVPSQYHMRWFTVISCNTSKSQNLYLWLSNSSEIWQVLAAMLPMCLSNFKVMKLTKLPILWLEDFPRSCNESSSTLMRQRLDHNKFLPLREVWRQGRILPFTCLPHPCQP